MINVPIMANIKYTGRISFEHFSPVLRIIRECTIRELFVQWVKP
jgi:hypothetical protein